MNEKIALEICRIDAMTCPDGDLLCNGCPTCSEKKERVEEKEGVYEEGWHSLVPKAQGYLEALKKAHELARLGGLTHRFLTYSASSSEDNKQYLINHLDDALTKWEKDK